MPRARSRSTASSSSSSSSTGTVKARVLLDTYSYHEKVNDPSTPTHTASKGDEISVSQEEFDRGASMVPAGLAKASSDTAPAGEPIEIPSDLSELKDSELRDLAVRLGNDVDDDTTRDELVGMVAFSPGGNERPQV